MFKRHLYSSSLALFFAFSPDLRPINREGAISPVLRSPFNAVYRGGEGGVVGGGSALDRRRIGRCGGGSGKSGCSRIRAFKSLGQAAAKRVHLPSITKNSEGKAAAAAVAAAAAAASVAAAAGNA